MNNNAKDYFVMRAKKYNHYDQCETVNNNNRCADCMRRKLSYPYTCNDGWPCGDENWVDKGKDCNNFTTDSNCAVD